MHLCCPCDQKTQQQSPQWPCIFTAQKKQLRSSGPWWLKITQGLFQSRSGSSHLQLCDSWRKNIADQLRWSPPRHSLGARKFKLVLERCFSPCWYPSTAVIVELTSVDDDVLRIDLCFIIHLGRIGLFHGDDFSISTVDTRTFMA